MKLKIECPEHHANAVAFAAANGCSAALQWGLDRLVNMCDENEKVFLYKDHAPLSFAFLITDGLHNRLVGGLIYSGPTQVLNGSAPTFTVSVDAPSAEHKWSVHT